MSEDFAARRGEALLKEWPEMGPKLHIVRKGEWNTIIPWGGRCIDTLQVTYRRCGAVRTVRHPHRGYSAPQTARYGLVVHSCSGDVTGVLAPMPGRFVRSAQEAPKSRREISKKLQSVDHSQKRP